MNKSEQWDNMSIADRIRYIEAYRNEQKEHHMQSNLDTGFWAKHDTRPSFVSKEEKRQIAESGEVFTVTHVAERQTGRFGPSWMLTILRNSGEITYLTLAKNPYRDSMMEDLREQASIMHGVDCSLELFTTDAGNEAYALCPPRQDDTVEVPF